MARHCYLISQLKTRGGTYACMRSAKFISYRTRRFRRKILISFDIVSIRSWSISADVWEWADVEDDGDAAEAGDDVDGRPREAKVLIPPDARCKIVRKSSNEGNKMSVNKTSFKSIPRSPPSSFAFVIAIEGLGPVTLRCPLMEATPTPFVFFLPRADSFRRNTVKLDRVKQMIKLTDVDLFSDSLDLTLGHIQLRFHLESQSILGC
jgi:hypothetical protein